MGDEPSYLEVEKLQHLEGLERDLAQAKQEAKESKKKHDDVVKGLQKDIKSCLVELEKIRSGDGVLEFGGPVNEQPEDRPPAT